MANSDKLSMSEAFEMITNEPQTDSFGSRSDYSGKFLGAHSKPRMDVIYIIDLQSHISLSDRKKAFEEVKKSCSELTNVVVHHIQVSFGCFLYFCHFCLQILRVFWAQRTQVLNLSIAF